MAERGQTTYSESMRGVTRSLPAMLRAVKVLKRLDEACGQKETVQQALGRAVGALQSAASAKDSEQALGDALLSVASLVRAMKIDPELALTAATDRLINRFEAIENDVLSHGNSIGEQGCEILAKYWNLVKLSESK